MVLKDKNLIKNSIPTLVKVKLKAKFEVVDYRLSNWAGEIRRDPTVFAYFWFKDRKGEKFRCRFYQDMILNDKSKRICVCISRQMGKSTMAAIKAFHQAYCIPNQTIVIVSSTKPQAVELIKKIKDLMYSGNFTNFRELLPSARDSKSELVIIHENGKESRIISIPATDAGRGYTADLVIVDEAAFIENGDYIFRQVIEPMTQATKGTILLLSTPNGSIGYFYDCFNSPYWSSYQFDWTFNPENTKEEMEQKKLEMTSLAFESEYEAKFTTSKSAYFKHDEIYKSISALAGCGAVTTNQPMAIGVDFGKIHDKSVIMIGYIINPKEDASKHIIRVLERREKPLGTEYAAVIGELKYIGKTLKPTIFVLDASGVGEVPAEILSKESGLITEPIKFSIQKKMEIFSNLKILFQQGRIQIPNEKEMINQLELFEYTYTESGNLKLHAREGYHDDECDALGLMAWGLTRAINPPVSIQII